MARDALLELHASGLSGVAALLTIIALLVAAVYAVYSSRQRQMAEPQDELECTKAQLEQKDCELAGTNAMLKQVVEELAEKDGRLGNYTAAIRNLKYAVNCARGSQGVAELERDAAIKRVGGLASCNARVQSQQKHLGCLRTEIATTKKELQQIKSKQSREQALLVLDEIQHESWEARVKGLKQEAKELEECLAPLHDRREFEQMKTYAKQATDSAQQASEEVTRVQEEWSSMDEQLEKATNEAKQCRRKAVLLCRGRQVHGKRRTIIVHKQKAVRVINQQAPVQSTLQLSSPQVVHETVPSATVATQPRSSPTLQLSPPKVIHETAPSATVATPPLASPTLHFSPIQVVHETSPSATVATQAPAQATLQQTPPQLVQAIVPSAVVQQSDPRPALGLSIIPAVVVQHAMAIHLSRQQFRPPSPSLDLATLYSNSTQQLPSLLQSEGPYQQVICDPYAKWGSKTSSGALWMLKSQFIDIANRTAPVLQLPDIEEIRHFIPAEGLETGDIEARFGVTEENGFTDDQVQKFWSRVVEVAPMDDNTMKCVPIAPPSVQKPHAGASMSKASAPSGIGEDDDASASMEESPAGASTSKASGPSGIGEDDNASDKENKSDESHKTDGSSEKDENNKSDEGDKGDEKDDGSDSKNRHDEDGDASGNGGESGDDDEDGDANNAEQIAFDEADSGSEHDGKELPDEGNGNQSPDESDGLDDLMALESKEDINEDSTSDSSVAPGSAQSVPQPAQSQSASIEGDALTLHGGNGNDAACEGDAQDDLEAMDISQHNDQESIPDSSVQPGSAQPVLEPAQLQSSSVEENAMLAHEGDSNDASCEGDGQDDLEAMDIGEYNDQESDSDSPTQPDGSKPVWQPAQPRSASIEEDALSSNEGDGNDAGCKGDGQDDLNAMDEGEDSHPESSSNSSTEPDRAMPVFQPAQSQSISLAKEAPRAPPVLPSDGQIRELIPHGGISIAGLCKAAGRDDQAFTDRARYVGKADITTGLLIRRPTPSTAPVSASSSASSREKTTSMDTLARSQPTFSTQSAGSVPAKQSLLPQQAHNPKPSQPSPLREATLACHEEADDVPARQTGLAHGKRTILPMPRPRQQRSRQQRPIAPSFEGISPEWRATMQSGAIGKLLSSSPSGTTVPSSTSVPQSQPSTPSYQASGISPELAALLEQGNLGSTLSMSFPGLKFSPSSSSGQQAQQASSNPGDVIISALITPDRAGLRPVSSAETSPPINLPDDSNSTEALDDPMLYEQSSTPPMAQSPLERDPNLDPRLFEDQPTAQSPSERDPNLDPRLFEDQPMPDSQV